MSKQCSTTQLNTVQRSAVHCSAVQRNTTQLNTVQRSALHCSAVQCNTTQLNTVQRSAVHCIAFQRSTTQLNTVQRSAMHCIALQRSNASSRSALNTVQCGMRTQHSTTQVRLYRLSAGAVQYSQCTYTHNITPLSKQFSFALP